MLDGIKQQINVLHEALSSHLLIASIIEGNCENLTLHQTVSIRENADSVPCAIHRHQHYAYVEKLEQMLGGCHWDCLKTGNHTILKFNNGEKLVSKV